MATCSFFPLPFLFSFFFLFLPFSNCLRSLWKIADLTSNPANQCRIVAFATRKSSRQRWRGNFKYRVPFLKSSVRKDWILVLLPILYLLLTCASFLKANLWFICQLLNMQRKYFSNSFQSLFKKYLKSCNFLKNYLLCLT